MPGRVASRPAFHERARRLSAAAPWAVSLALHAALVVIGLFVGWIVVSPDDGAPMATVSFSDPSPPPPAPMGAEPERSIEDLLPIDEPEAPTIDFDPTPTPTIDELLTPIEAPVIELPKVKPPEPDAATSDASVPDVTVYGTGASDARRLVYIVDGSASMVATLPMVIAELKDSIERLAPTQDFQVYFFRAGDYEAFEPTGEDPEVPRSTLHPATNANKRAAYAWLDRYRPSGTSNPLYAIEVALVHPEIDAIFLLSTRITGIGTFEESREAFMQSLDTLNPKRGRSGARRVAIKVVQFFDRDPSGLLAEIGREHGGPDGYTFVPREEVVR